MSKRNFFTIEDIAEKVAMGPFGSNIKVSTFVDSGVPVISGQHLNDYYLTDNEFNFITEEHAERLKNSNVYRGDVIFTHAGNIGQVSCIPENSKYERYILSQRQFYLRCDKTCANPAYITYFFKSREGQNKLLANASQVGVPSIARPASYLRSIELELPSIDEQNKVVKVLDSIGSKIALNRKLNETLEQMARALFQSWFVDFDPVKAKLAAKRHGRDPERACMAAISGKLRIAAGKPSEERLDDQLPTADELDAAIAALDTLTEAQRQQLAETAGHFPDEFQDSELGLIPEDWGIACIGQMLELAYGKALKKTDRNPGPYPVYGSGGITGNHESWLVGGPGIIVGRKGTIGRVYWEDNSFFPIDTVFYVKPLNGYSLSFLFYLLDTVGLSEMNTDAAVPGLNRTNVYRLELPSYPVPLVAAFSSVVDTMHSGARSIKDQSRTLAELRDTLLPKLLSGELSVNVAEDAVEEVAAL